MLTDEQCEEIARKVRREVNAHPFRDGWTENIDRALIRAGYAAAIAAREQEPVAWRKRHELEDGEWMWRHRSTPLPGWEPLYAHPAPARSQDDDAKLRELENDRDAARRDRIEKQGGWCDCDGPYCASRT